MTKAEARKAVGGLSRPSKMPGFGFSLQPRVTCPNGAKMARDCTSVCSACYAVRGRYRFKTMIPAWATRLEATRRDDFVASMIAALKGEKFFRWHDTGDVYSADYWHKILAIAKGTPNTLHWLPTKEYWTAMYSHPDNLVVRYSYPKLDPTREQAERWIALYGNASTTSQGNYTPWAHRCSPVLVWSAREQRMVPNCGECRACWDKSVKCIDYKLH